MIQQYVDRLAAQVAGLAQVRLAPRPAPSRVLDTEGLLRGLIEPAVAGGAWLLAQPAEPSYPNAVYQLVSSQPRLEGAYEVARVDTFLVFIRAETPDALRAAGNAVIDALAVDARGWEVADHLTDYDEQQQIFRYNLEVSLTYLPFAEQDLPAAVLYPLGEQAAEDELDGCTREQVVRRFGVVIAAGKTDDPEALLDQAAAALLGYQLDANTWPALYQGAEPLDSPAALQLSAAVFADSVMTQGG